MHRQRASFPLLLLLVATGCAGQDPHGPNAWRHGGEAIDVLVFTRTEGFTHGSIPDGVNALEELGADRGWAVQSTDDAAMFDPATLAAFDVVVFLSTTGDVLDDEQQLALEGFVQAGGGWVGVHSASDTEYDWPWYGGLVGAYFINHPAPQEATLTVVDADHPAMVGVPDPWVRTDEWYNFDAVPAGVDILLTIDESSYDGGTMGRLHPMAWSHTYDGGRAFYTAGGHTSQSYGDPVFRGHLAGGIEWAAADDEPTTGSGTAGSSEEGGSTAAATGSEGDDTGAEGSGGAGSGDTGEDPPSTSGAGSTGAGGSDSSCGSPSDDDTGGCRLGGAPQPAWWAALVLLGWRRRRGGC